MDLYGILSEAQALYRQIHADYPDEDERLDGDPRWETWGDLMQRAETFLPEDVAAEGLLCEFREGWTRGDLWQLLVDGGCIEYYPS